MYKKKTNVYHILDQIPPLFIIEPSFWHRQACIYVGVRVLVAVGVVHGQYVPVVGVHQVLVLLIVVHELVDDVGDCSWRDPFPCVDP